MEKKDKPNIIIFNPDQWRGDMLGYLGYSAAKTPNLDSIVNNDAIAFNNAFCQATVCTPSRCSFMTGWYPCLLYTSPSPRDRQKSRMPSSA